MNQYPKISDHKPIVTEIQVDCQPTLESLHKYIRESEIVLQNHSKLPNINLDLINTELMENLMNNNMQQLLNNINNKSTEYIASQIQNNILKIGKLCKLPRKT